MLTCMSNISFIYVRHICHIYVKHIWTYMYLNVAYMSHIWTYKFHISPFRVGYTTVMTYHLMLLDAQHPTAWSFPCPEGLCLTPWSSPVLWGRRMFWLLSLWHVFPLQNWSIKSMWQLRHVVNIWPKPRCLRHQPNTISCHWDITCQCRYRQVKLRRKVFVDYTFSLREN